MMVAARRSTRLVATAVATILALAACGGPDDDSPDELADSRVERAAQDSHVSLVDELYVDPADYDFASNPDLLDRVVGSAHGYFRFINIPFSQAVCGRWAAEWADSASIAHTLRLNLHGDAHIEQYAVTELGRGLTDFDDSSTGPAALDALRFGVSLLLASRANGFEEKADESLNAFAAGYRAALEDPDAEAPEPQIARRKAASFQPDREAYFEFVSSQMEPMPEAERDRLLQSMQAYVERIRMEDPDLRDEFFDVVGTGGLKLGIGSALDRKYLVRVKGDTDDPMDDEVLEIKEVRSLAGIDCIEASEDDPFRVLLSQARIAYRPFDHLGYMRLDGRNFWVHAWVQNYDEIEIEESFESPEELAEVAYDAGIQLGRGHHKMIAAPFDAQLKQAQLEFLDTHSGEVAAAARELADAVVEAWRRFREAVVAADTSGRG
ncbi:MAG: DUF2252 family protein [Gemmatimonadota bacterium]